MTTLETPPTELVSVFGDGDWVTYQATLSFTGRIIGGSPSDPHLVEGWLKSNLGITDEEQLRQWTIKHLAETQGLDPGSATDDQIEQAIKENAIEKKAQVFKRTPDGQPYIEGRQIKAMLKEATNIVAPFPEKWGKQRNAKGDRLVGGKTPKDYVAERVWVPEHPYPLAVDTDGFDLAVGHVPDGFGGRRSTLGYFEYIIRPVFTLTLQVLDDCITGEQWADIMRTAEREGLGARRSQGAGQFVVTAWAREEV